MSKNGSLKLGFATLLLTCMLSAQPEPRLNHLLQHPPNYGGATVASDFDNDGDLDIIFRPHTAVGLFADDQGTIVENLGDREFGQPRRTHHQHRIDGPAVVGDFISDEQLDFLISESSTDINIGGSYAHRPVAIRFAPFGGSEKRVPLAPFSQYGWVGVDLDADHAPELLQLEHHEESSTTLRLLEKSTDGTYIPVVEETDFPGLIDINYDSPVLDLDGDGDYDLVGRYISDFYPVLLERTGPRSFSTQVHQPTSDLEFPAWSDFDGDGLPDLYSFGTTPFLWKKNLGGFQFDSTRTADPGSEFAIQRLLDIEQIPSEPALLTYSQITAEQVILTTLRFGSWEVIRQSSLDHPAGFGYGEPELDLFHDIDGDGNQDLLVRYRLPNESLRSIPRLAIAWGTSSGLEPLGFINSPAPTAENLVIGDFDGTGSPDLILGPDIEGFHHLLQNDGEGRFLQSTRLDELAPPIGTPAGTRIATIHSGDLNSDSVLDLAVEYQLSTSSSGYHSACGVAIGNGDGSFLPPVLPEGSFETIVESPCGVDELVDWDGDGDLDAVGDGTWRENTGGVIAPDFRPLIGAAQSVDLLGNPTTIGSFSTGDLDGDGNMDICSAAYRIVRDPQGGLLGGTIIETTAAIGFSDDHGGISQVSEFSAFTAGSDLLGNPTSGRVAFADLNADSQTDLAILEFKSYDLLGNPIPTYSWRRNPGNGSRDPNSWPVLPLTNLVFPSGEKLDFNGDLMLEWVSPEGYLIPTLAGPQISPSYDFTKTIKLENAKHLGTADFDGDGDADFLLGDELLGLSLLRNPLVEERSAITRYLISQGASPDLASPGKDLDGDGRSNEVEFLEGTRVDEFGPSSPNPFSLEIATNGVIGSLTYCLPYYSHPQYPAEGLNLIHSIEYSVDMQSWSKVDQASAELIFLGGGKSYLSLPLMIESPNGFYRINAQHILND